MHWFLACLNVLVQWCLLVKMITDCPPVHLQAYKALFIAGQESQWAILHAGHHPYLGLSVICCLETL